MNVVQYTPPTTIQWPQFSTNHTENCQLSHPQGQHDMSLMCIYDPDINMVKEFNGKNHTGSLDHEEKGRAADYLCQWHTNVSPPSGD